MSAAIIARELTHSFGDLIAVDHVNLNISAGEIFGFLGPNGSGKSTTIRLLCGLLKLKQGEVEILGYRMPRDAEHIRSHLGYMTQRFSLYEDLTVMENLQFIARIHSYPVRKRGDRIKYLLEKYQLQDLIRQRTGTLSGGQKQRLALAAVTLHEPSLLLLDEPTSAVDPQSRREFWADLFRLAGDGTTILVSTHYMDEAERCHELAILDHGRIVSAGTPSALVREIDALVICVETDKPAQAHDLLISTDWVRSVAQLGNSLNVMVGRSMINADAVITSLLGRHDIDARAEPISASLEDVFVAATGFRKG